MKNRMTLTKCIVASSFVTIISCGAETQPTESELNWISTENPNSPPETRKTLYYIKRDYVYRAYCHADVAAVPSLCDARVLENSRGLRHSYAIRRRDFEEYFETAAPAGSTLLARVIPALEDQKRKIEESLAGPNPPAVPRDILQRQLQMVRNQLERNRSLKADRDEWVKLLDSPIVIDIPTEGGEDEASVGPALKFVPFVRAMQQVFAHQENLEYKLHDWTCSTLCEVTTQEVNNNDYSYSRAGAAGGHYQGFAGQVLYRSTSYRNSTRGGFQTRAEAERAAAEGCSQYSERPSTSVITFANPHPDLHHQRIDISRTWSTTSAPGRISCTFSDPKPHSTPVRRPF